MLLLNGSYRFNRRVLFVGFRVISRVFMFKSFFLFVCRRKLNIYRFIRKLFTL